VAILFSSQKSKWQNLIFSFSFGVLDKGYSLTKNLFGKAIVNGTNRRKNVVFASDIRITGGLLTLRGKL
jgi:hypothetical protein